jgi:hypothetical protein
MITHCTHILVVTFSCLLALATSASAECAWVLWEAYPGHQGEWKAITAATSHDKCEEKATQFYEIEPRTDTTWPNVIDTRV